MWEGCSQIEVVFSCQQCGLIYQVIQSRSLRETDGRFNCADCGSEVAKWSGRYDLSGWTMLDKVHRPISVGKPKAQVKIPRKRGKKFN